MKKWIVLSILLSVFTTSWAWGQTSTLATYQLSGTCQYSECEICGAKIVRWVEGSVNYFGSNLMIGYGSWCSGIRQESLGFNWSISVCESCKSKYQGELTKLLEPLAKKFLLDKQIENEKVRRLNLDKNRNEEIRDLTRKAKELLDQAEQKRKETK